MDVEWNLGFDILRLTYGKRLVAEVHNDTAWCVKNKKGEVLHVGKTDTIEHSQMEAAHKAIELDLLSYGGGRVSIK
tara:strand:- start:2242 stop:2469 length:228 start_codon:yes stop_codon:yes gene_type:complete